MSRLAPQREIKRDRGEECEILVQLGDEYRQRQENDLALDCYKAACAPAKACGRFDNLAHSHRSIASILSEVADGSDRQHVQQFLLWARKSGQHNLIQLALHEVAFIYLGYASQDKQFLLEAFDKALQCRTYLAEHAKLIDSDAEAIRTAENSRRRMAGINSLLSEVYQLFGDYKNAQKYNDMAVDYARSVNDYNLLYNCSLMKVELTKGSAKVDVSRRRAEMAHQHLKHNASEADLEFVRQNLNFYSKSADTVYAVLKVLLKLYKTKSRHAQVARNYLIFMWKLDRRLELLNQANSQTEKMEIAERIADSAVEFRMFDLALTYYSAMLENAISPIEREKSLTSIAETNVDLGDFKAAADCYEKCLHLIYRNFPDDERKISETEVSLAVNRSKDTQLQVDDRFRLLKEQYAKHKSDMFGDVLLEAITLFVSMNKDRYTAAEVGKWRDLWKKSRNDQHEEGPTEDEVSLDPERDEFDDVDESKMIQSLEKLFQKHDEQQLLAKKKDARNNKGETLLHEASRDGNVERVKTLLTHGYDVNARDFGGWTPLSEAVNHGHLEVSRVLLQHGAFVDCQSGQSLDSAGDTPLMEACTNGHIEVARLLLSFKASVTKTNNSNHNALHFLRLYVKNNNLSSSERQELSQLSREMEERQRKEGLDNDFENDTPVFAKKSVVDEIADGTARVRCHSPVQIVDDTRQKTKRKPVTRRPTEPRSGAARVVSRSPSIADVPVALAERESNSVSRRLSLDVSEPAKSRKRTASPSTASNVSKRSNNLVLVPSMSSSNHSSRNERPENTSEVVRKKRVAFGKRYFTFVDPLTGQPVNYRRSFADDGIDIDGIITSVNQIFIGYTTAT